MSLNCINEIKKEKKKKINLVIVQISILLLFITAWEFLSKYNLIDSFLFSSPSKIIKLLIEYLRSNELIYHIGVSLLEVILGLVVGTFIGIVVSSILWFSDYLQKVLDPFLMVINALPKTALAPIIIIWAGTGVKGIVMVSLSILVIITIISSYNYFKLVEEEKIKMMKSFKATKLQIYFKLILPSNISNIISIIKINVGMSWIGVIVGEFLVSRAGIGYLIMYGGQVFNMDLVMMGVIVLAILAWIMGKIVDIINDIYIKNK